MMRWMRKIHKWVGLVLAIQFVLWMASGVVLSLLDAEKVAGREFRVKPPTGMAWPGEVVPVEDVLAKSAEPVLTIASGWLMDVPVYRLANKHTGWIVNAGDGSRLVIDAAMVTKIARASYSGSGSPGAPRLLNYSLETRKHKEAVWRVDFSDADDTSVYVSAKTGNVIEHRNSTWRLYDFFWMLHIMDYSERENINNKLVVASSIGGVFVSLTGVWLLFVSFRLAEFVPRRWRRGRKAVVA